MEDFDFDRKEFLSRCSCCDSVSSIDIANNPERYKPRMTFYTDPQDTSLIVCAKCLEAGNLYDADYDTDYEWNTEEILMIAEGSNR